MAGEIEALRKELATKDARIAAINEKNNDLIDTVWNALADLLTYVAFLVATVALIALVIFLL